jgi:hypothetical protein
LQKKYNIDISQCDNYKQAVKARNKLNHFKLDEWWNSSKKFEDIKKIQAEFPERFKAWETTSEERIFF